MIQTGTLAKIGTTYSIRFLMLTIGILFFVTFVGENSAWAKMNDALAKCVRCHKEYIEDWEPTKHGKIFINNPRNELEARVCESCHGNGANHIVDASRVAGAGKGKVDNSLILSFSKTSRASMQEKNEACQQCHEKDKNRFVWRGSDHEAAGISCVECHQYGKPSVKGVKKRNITRNLAPSVDIRTEQCVSCHSQRRAQLQRTSHMPYREGKMSCADCHNPHGSTGPSLLKKASINQTCYSCHQEKRGPMIWEHPPVRENCMNCHNPHGSNYQALLKTKAPFLCQSCHMGTRHISSLYSGSTLPGGSPSAFSLGKGCVNCHSKIHGSNHPSGARFQR